MGLRNCEVVEVDDESLVSIDGGQLATIKCDGESHGGNGRQRAIAVLKHQLCIVICHCLKRTDEDGEYE